MASALRWHSEFAAEEAEWRPRPRSLSVGDAPFEEPELCDEVAIVVKGTFYELQHAAFAPAIDNIALDVVLLSDCEECKSTSSTAECKSARWSDEGTTECSGDLESVVDLASDGGSEGNDFWGWAWTAELTEISSQQCWFPQKQKRRVRRRGVRPQLPCSCSSEPTTLLLKSLGPESSSASLVELLEEQGLGGDFDFVYAPASFKNWEAVGYAVVNMIDHSAALKAMDVLEGLGIAVGWNEPCQGLEVQIARYRNSPVMHASVPDECRPRLFSEGLRQAFPQPTRAIKPPR